MVIFRKEYMPVILEFMTFIEKGKIQQSAVQHYQNVGNQVAHKLGIKYEGLYEIFNYCEENNISNDSVNSLFSLLKTNVNCNNDKHPKS